MSEVRYPDITVQLSGQDGNIFNLMALVKRDLPAKVRGEFVDAVMNSQSYDEALQEIMRWVNVQ